MNWKAIREQAELYKGAKTTYPRRWFNEAKHLLANMYLSACKFSDTTIDVNDTSISYALPADTKYVRQIRDEHDKPVTLYSVDIMEGNIRFAYVGTYNVTCAFETDDIVGADGEIPQIKSVYHYAMAKYIASKELEYTRPEKSKELLSEFYAEVDQANKSASVGRKGRIIMPARRSY
jgi:hypothetical protein